MDTIKKEDELDIKEEDFEIVITDKETSKDEKLKSEGDTPENLQLKISEKEFLRYKNYGLIEVLKTEVKTFNSDSHALKEQHSDKTAVTIGHSESLELNEQHSKNTVEMDGHSDTIHTLNEQYSTQIDLQEQIEYPLNHKSNKKHKISKAGQSTSIKNDMYQFNDNENGDFNNMSNSSSSFNVKRILKHIYCIVKGKEKYVKWNEESVKKIEGSVKSNKQSVTWIEECVKMNKESVKKAEESVKKIEESVKKKEKSVKRNEESLSRIEASVKRNEEILTRISAFVKINKESVKRNEESVKKNEESVTRIEASVKRNEAAVKKNDESVTRIEESVKRIEESLNAIKIHLSINVNGEPIMNPEEQPIKPCIRKLSNGATYMKKTKKTERSRALSYSHTDSAIRKFLESAIERLQLMTDDYNLAKLNNINWACIYCGLGHLKSNIKRHFTSTELHRGLINREKINNYLKAMKEVNNAHKRKYGQPCVECCSKKFISISAHVDLVHKNLSIERCQEIVKIGEMRHSAMQNTEKSFISKRSIFSDSETSDDELPQPSLNLPSVDNIEKDLNLNLPLFTKFKTVFLMNKYKMAMTIQKRYQPTKLRTTLKDTVENIFRHLNIFFLKLNVNGWSMQKEGTPTFFSSYYEALMKVLTRWSQNRSSGTTRSSNTIQRRLNYLKSFYLFLIEQQLCCISHGHKIIEMTNRANKEVLKFQTETLTQNKYNKRKEVEKDDDKEPTTSQRKRKASFPESYEDFQEVSWHTSPTKKITVIEACSAKIPKLNYKTINLI